MPTAEQYCSQCGEMRPGKQCWRANRFLETFPEWPIRREFICHQCIRRERIYGAIAVGAIIIALIALAVFLLYG